MQEIQNQAIKTYLENLEYFKNNHLDLYNRITMLSSAIDTEQYKERYHLEYIQDDQEFDILDTHNETYLYNRKPKEFIETAVNNSNLDKENSIDLLHEDVYNATQKYSIDKDINDTVRTMHSCVNDIIEYTKLFKKSTKDEKKEFKYIEKFIFVGTLLGKHIQGITNKLKFKLCMIYEYNLEIFRLSLFTTNYAAISAKSRIIFSIMDDEINLKEKLNDFLRYQFRSNYMVKYYSSNYNINNFFETLKNVHSQEHPFNINYNRVLEEFIKPSLINIPKYRTLNTSTNTKILKNTPVLIIAAGPSFGKNIQWIVQNKNSFFIVAIGAVVEKLISLDIKPDLIVSSDSAKIISEQFPHNIKDTLSTIPFLTSASTHQSVLDMFNFDNIILYEIMTKMKKNSILLDGYSVGETALELSIILGANTLYLLGSDLSFDKESGSSHFDEYERNFTNEINTKVTEENTFSNYNILDYKNATHQIKGNLQDFVNTNIIFERSINAYEKSIQKIHDNNPDVKIFNLNDGAFLKGAIPTKIDEIKTDKPVVKENIIVNLKKLSTLGFEQTEKDNLLKTLEIIDNLIFSIKTLQKRKQKNYDDFVRHRDAIYTMINVDLLKYDSCMVDKIFMLYILSTESYLGYQFNDKNFKDELSQLKKVKKIWSNHMLNLARTYKEIVLEIINN